MKSKRILLDTSVWISYFGDRPENCKARIELSRNIITYCLAQKMQLFYCSYVEFELNQANQKNRPENIEKMKLIAENIPAHTGNDTLDQIVDVTWENWGSLWNIEEEETFGDELQKQLPDKKNKSNRRDRNIIVTAKYENIDAILHENPKDFKKIKTDSMTIIDLTKLDSLNDFIEEIEKHKF